LRLVAFAAVLILTLAPESLLSASFQMSFAAAIALIAAYEAWQAYRARRPREAAGPGGRVLRSGAAVAFTTVVASAATAPFAIHHFNRLAVYGLAANMIAVPLTAMLILPMGILGLLAMPLGLEEGPLAVMSVGIDLVLSIARWVAGWPGAVALLPALSAAGLAILCLGGLWLAIWRGRWRLAGLPLIAAGFASGALTAPPDLLVSDDGRLVAVRDAQDRLSVSTEVGRRFDGEIWLRRAAQAEARVWPQAGRAARGRLRCDSLGCLFRAHARTVAIVRDPMALPDDCRSADVIVMQDYLRVYCPSADHVIDRFALWRNGSHAIWIGLDGHVTVRNARETRGQRPWVLDPYATRDAQHAERGMEARAAQ
jgi:competence protein ComEC